MENSNILVVDDSMSNLLLLKDILSGYQYNVIIENDGAKVVDVLKNNKVDLILLDIMMPNVDGFEVCRRVKAEPQIKEIPIIFLTAKVDENSLLKGFDLGGVDYIKKPFLISELIARVKTHLQLRKSNERLKNELYQHFLTQQSLQVSQNDLGIRNTIASIFLTHQQNEIYISLLEEILKYISCKYGAIAYINEENLIMCPAQISETKTINENIEYKISDIGTIAKVISQKTTIIENQINQKPFYTQMMVSYMITVPIIYREEVIGFISASGDCGDTNNGKLERIADYLSPIFHSRLSSHKYNIARRKAELLLQESEEKYRTLFNQNNDAVFVYDFDENGNLHFSEVNNTAINMLGYSRDEILKAKPGNFVEPVFSSTMVDKLRLVATDGPQTFETYLTSKNGNLVPVEIHAGKFNRANKFSIMSVARDISERKNIDKQILNTIVETEERERTRFAKDVHDGLGAFLSSLNTYVNLLSHDKIAQDELPAVYLEMKELIAEAVAESKSISNNLMPDILANFGLVASIKTLCKRLIPGNTPKIIFETQNFVEPESQKCKTAIFRIVNELLNNAVKHSNAKKIVMLFATEGKFISIKYSDDGIGFDLNQVQEQIKLKTCSGLNNLQGRISSLNGEMKINTSPNNGVKIDILIDNTLKDCEVE
ncbi:MAG: response regulator [Bacteroidales bacterium]|nr:response regulator [Bacteroidales bacterium]